MPISPPKGWIAGFPPDSDTSKGRPPDRRNRLHDRLGAHRGPALAIGAVHRMQAVAPRTAVIAPAKAHENRGHADQRAFALNRRAKDLGHAQRGFVAHGRYSAHVLGVSLTRTADTSGHCAWHQ